jgi:energy-coupling factor transporter ATP-binding protein EcfA2
MKNGIIAFCGAKGSGKSTSANIVRDLISGTEELAFAGHLKTVCSKVFNIDMKYFIDPSLKEVELDKYIVLNKESIEAVFREFDITDYTYDKHVRPHVSGQVFDTPRMVLQYIGTEVLHPIDPLIHAKMTMKNKSSDALTLITDLRFQQEFDFVKNQPGFIAVYVANDKAESFAGKDGHKSERELQLFKHECIRLDNNGSLTDLRVNLTNLLKGLDI